jgi:hypothetical protein
MSEQSDMSPSLTQCHIDVDRPLNSIVIPDFHTNVFFQLGGTSDFRLPNVFMLEHTNRFPEQASGASDAMASTLMMPPPAHSQSPKIE